MTLRVLLSAPYVIPIFDRFKDLFDEVGIEVVIAEVVGGRHTVVGTLAVRPADRPAKTLGKARDLEVLPVPLRVHHLGAELDVLTTRAQGQRGRGLELNPELTDPVAAGSALPASGRPIKRGRAARD